MAIDTTVTLKRLIAEFSEWATAHPMVNDFGYGQYLESFRTSENKYAAVIVNSPSATSEDFFINYSLEVICLDYVLDQNDNRDQVNSDTMDILRDLENTIRYSKRWKEFSRADGQWSYRKVDEFGADKCFGWIATFTIKLKKKHGICDIKSLMPTYDFETGSVVFPSCDPATLSFDGVEAETIPSGSNLNILVEDQDGNTPDYSYSTATKILTVQPDITPTPVDITINSTLVYSQVTTDQTLQSLNSDNEQKGSLVSGVWRLPDTNMQFQDDDIITTPAGQNMNVKVIDQSNNEVGTPNVVDQNHLEIIVNSPPTAGLFIPLSWTGANVVNYAFQVPATTPNTYNTIARLAGVTSFDMNIFSNETMLANEDWVMEGDNVYLPTASYFIGFGLQSITGINFANIDFCFFVTTSGVVNWIQSGVTIGTVATLTASNYWSWRLEYNGTTKNVGLYINGNLVHTAATGYTTQTLVVKICGRNGSQNNTNHLALRKIASSNRILVPFGDSISANNPTANFPGRSYIEKMISFSNHKYFVNPVLATSGHTTANLIASQLPLASVHYDASYTSNVVNLMIGINDIRTSVALATIQTNIQSIVSSLQSTGYFVIIHTVLRDFSTAWANRPTLNVWILAGSSGADDIVDHTTSVLESDSSFFQSDGLHPNANGMTQIAFETYAHLNSAP